MSEDKSADVLDKDFKYKELLISEKKFLVGVCKKDDVRRVLLTNSSEFYEDNLSKDDILRRCEELNPVLIDPKFEDVEDIIDDLLANIPKYAVSVNIEKIQLENKIDDGWFRFEIDLKRCSPEYFKNNFMDNFYFAFSELQHRYNCLLDIIKKKDQEIAEYKAEGVELLRKSVITEPFNENVFQNKLRNKRSGDKLNLFLDTLNFYNSVQSLKSNDDMKQEITVVNPESCNDEVPSEQTANNNQAPKRLFSSDDLRCAVAPKSQRTAQSSKRKKSKFAYL